MSSTATTAAPESNQEAFRCYNGDSHENLACRYYEAEFPREGGLVMAQVKSIQEMGVYCSLLEYGGMEGMIVKPEISPRSVIRSIHNHVRVNRNEVVKVLSVDKAKGFIDFTKKRVSAKEAQEYATYYKKAKNVHGILSHVAKMHKLYLQDLYERIGWPLYKKYGHAYDAFRLFAAQDCVIGAEQEQQPQDMFESMNLPQNLERDLEKCIRQRLAPQPIKIRSDIDVTCYTMEGVDAIRDALLAGMQTNDDKIKIKLLVSPTFALSTVVVDESVGIQRLNSAIDVIFNEITQRGGEMKVKTEPRSVTKRQESALLKEALEKDKDLRQVSVEDVEEDELIE